LKRDSQLISNLLEVSYKKSPTGENHLQTLRWSYGRGNGWAISSFDRISAALRTVLTAWVEDDMISG
jgi:hypothetical protein